MEVLHLAGALMEHFLEESAPLRLWYVNSEENIIFVSLLIWFNVLTEQFLKIFPPLREK